VLVHRESEEYKEEDESSPSSPGNGNGHGISCGPERLAKQAPPQIRISTGSVESTMDTCLMPTVQIMVDSPKDPPRGDFSAIEDVDAPIDVNVQGDTSQVFYEYNPDKATADHQDGEEEEKEALDEALPDKQR